MERELAVRDVDLVGGDTDGHGRSSLPPVKLPHRAKVAPGQDIGIDHEEGLAQPLPEEEEGAHRAQRRGLEGVADANAEAGAVAEPLPDHLRLVVEGDGDVGDPRLAQALDHDLDERSAAHEDEGLGRGLRERPEPPPFPARHDHGGSGQGRRGDLLLEEEHVHEPPARVHEGQVADGAREHQLDRGRAPEAGRGGHGRG